MALSAREMLLILRARDEATTAIRAVGGSIRTLGDEGLTSADKLAATGAALLGIGTAMAGLGATGLSFFQDATALAQDYNYETALTLTQANGLGTSIQELGDIGRRVADEIPAPFEQMQQGLFDIFSTVDATVPQAEMLLTNFAKGAVAGGAEIQEVSTVTMAALNAWQRPMEDVTQILDTQFALVREGVGSYSAFAGALGRAIPAAVAAEQSFETLAGAMAFMTRQGLTPEMSATSIARALELIAKPDSVANLEAIGVAVRDNNGHFKSLNDIITDLAVNQGWAQMTGPERKKAFEDVFGTGTIQARRFFDLAIPNYELLNQLMDTVGNGAGSMEEAYEIMFGTPAMQSQALRNEWALLKEEIGTQLLPAKIALMEKVQELIDWWNSLDESTRNLIVQIAAFGSALLAIVGTVIAVVGAVLLFIGIAAPVVGSVTALIGVFAGALVVLAAFAAVAWLIYENWDTVGPILADIWNEIVESVQAVIDVFDGGGESITASGFSGAIQEIALFVRDTLIPALQEGWAATVEFATMVADAFMTYAWPAITAVWDAFVILIGWIGTFIGNIPGWYQATVDFFQGIWDKILEWWTWLEETFGPALSDLWDTIVTEVGDMATEVQESWDTLKANISQWLTDMEPVIQFVVDLWYKVVDELKLAWDAIAPYIDEVMNNIGDIIAAAWTFIQGVWDAAGQAILNGVVTTWNFIWEFIEGILIIISNLFQFWNNIYQEDYREAWDNIKNILSAAWTNILSNAVSFVFELLAIFVQLQFQLLVLLIGLAGHMLWNGVEIMLSLERGLRNGVIAVWNFINSIDDRIIAFFAGAGRWLWNAGVSILTGLLNGAKSKWSDLTGWFGGLGGKIVGLKGPPKKDRVLLVNNGRLLMQGLHQGLQEGWNEVENYLTGLSRANNFEQQFGLSVGNSNADLIAALYAIASQAEDKIEAGLYVQGDVVLGGADDVEELDWWAGSNNAGV